MTRLDAESAALYAIIAIMLVLIGGLLTAGPVTIEQRGTLLAGIITVLFAVAWRGRRRHHVQDRDDDDEVT